MMLDGILGRDDNKRLRKIVGLVLRCHLSFTHGLQQSTLGLRCGSIDLVGQNHVGEQRALAKFELML